MRYKRDEAFRYEFGTPIPCEIKIIKINEQRVDSSEGDANIHDLSPSGLRIASDLDLLSDRNDVEIRIRFTLSDGPTELGNSEDSDSQDENIVTGKIIWQKPHFSGEQFYGVELYNDDQTKDQIIDQLKHFIQQEKSTN
ncbi:PilZ domain-containing protein [Aquibacillus sediminis]|uniref:PilZ domain-containing protein n=1 Tax=Aquibacillus sediminis TaxID=2574734 RepID=UPI001108307D|nr:PilZ domain-containing protein [Aquibacillus sediminis]